MSRTTTSCSASACTARMASPATARTRTSRTTGRTRSPAKGKCSQHRQPRSRRGHLQAGRRRAQARRIPVRLSPSALHVPREDPHERSRHLPPAPHLDVLTEREAQEGLNVRWQKLACGGRSFDGRRARCAFVEQLRHVARSRLHQRRVRSPTSRTCSISAAARREGDALIVAVNSDRSVRAIKGPSRPLNPESERAEVLAALECVDVVVVFDEDDPQQIISRLQPDVLVKGADWAARRDHRPRDRRGPRRSRLPDPARRRLLDVGDNKKKYGVRRTLQ